MGNAEELLVRGRQLHAGGDLAGAERLYRQALEQEPANASAWCLLGMARSDAGAIDEAIQCYRQAVRLEPGQHAANHNLGNALLLSGDEEAAIGQFRRALAIDPDCADCHKALGLAHLRRGQFAEGWAEYEWRLKCKDKGQFRPYTRLWDGTPHPDGTILLVAEQGLGDTIQFVRYAPLVRQRCAKVILECQKPLIRLLSQCAGIDRIIPRGGEPPEFAAEVPLLSLPRILHPTEQTVPLKVPYLSPDPALVQYWKQVLSGFHGMKVGLAWQGHPAAPVDRPRSIPLARLALLGAVEGVQLVSLQKGAGCEQLADGSPGLRLMDIGERLDGKSGPFMDTAAIIANLDLVITVDTAVAHLAGALGAPVWILLSYACDWRWLADRDDTPWYPTARLFRQTSLGDWDGVIARVADALREEVRKRAVAAPSARPLMAPVSAGELIDRITILQIKRQRIDDPGKLAHVLGELAELSAARGRDVPPSPRLRTLADELREVNGRLWDIEDEIRQCERRQDFGPRFIELARSVYAENDRRSEVKREINLLLGSEIVEEKSYAAGACAAPAGGSSPRTYVPRPLLEAGPLRLKRCRHGAMLYPAADMYIGRSLDRYGEFSEGEMEVMRQVVRPGQLVLDVGANIGTHTVVLARIVGDGGSVLAFEPQRRIFQILCANVALNALGNVHTHHAAVGRQPGSITVPRLDLSAACNFGGLSLQGAARGEPVPVMTIDGLNLPACHFMKIDVEGMEGEVLAGAERTICKYRPVLYLENDREDRSAALISELLRLEYRLYWHLPRLYNPKNHFANEENIFANTISVNVLAIHASAKQNITGLREIRSPQDTWRRA